MEISRLYGLVGRNIAHSFSKKFFTDKFAGIAPDYSYENFDLDSVDEFPQIIQDHPNLAGLNVTIPYKEAIIPYLGSLSKNARSIGAVNTIRIMPDKTLKGYNTDHFGFRKSIQPLLAKHHKNALILGTGGAAKAVAFALDKLGIFYTMVSREEGQGIIGYNRLNATTFDNFQIVINCTPLGTSPNENSFPDIPYEYFTPKHIAHDLVYNPEKTEFMRRAESRGAVVKNGYEMLVFQAEKSWEIWNR